MTRYDIPGFSRYYATYPPFRVINRETGHALTPYIAARSKTPRIGLNRDDGLQRATSVAHLAALAFHGQPPAGHVAYHYGGPLTPKTVKWLPETEARRLWCEQKVSRWEQLKIVELYFRHGLTQREIARRFDISQPTVAYHIKQYYERSTS